MKAKEQSSIPVDLKHLISEAHIYLETNETQQAIKTLLKGIAPYSNHEKFCFELGYAFYEDKNHAECAKWLKKSIKLNPLNRPQKFYTMAQISDDKPATNLYKNGIEVSLIKILEISKIFPQSEKTEQKLKSVKRITAQAYCGLATLEEKKLETGEQKKFSEPDFLRYLSSAFEMDALYLETYILAALYYFNCQNEGLWKQSISALISQIRKMEENEDGDLDEYTCEYFLPLTRILIECEMWEESAFLMEVGINNEEGHLEGNYLYAFALFNSQKYQESKEAISKLEKLKVGECGDVELIEWFNELKKAKETKMEEEKENEQDWINEEKSSDEEN